MAKYLKILLILITPLIATNHTCAQVYPVQVTSQIVPPFTPYLSDYTAPGAQKFMVHIRVNDPTVPDYTCKLRLTIEGVNITIHTKQSFIPPPLILQGGGVPQIFYGEDLIEYFNPNALDFSGISRSDYEKGAKLPEGVYKFTIEVLDYHRNTTVSNKGTAIAWVILNDPPILNLPRNDTKVTATDPMFIPFTWTPRNTGSPNSAFTTEYKFKIVEVWPITRNPYDAFLSQPALYETTTDQTQIIYGLTEPALLPGRKYAWQVQAIDQEGRDLFKNQGKSEVFVFQFGDALGIPDGLYLQSAGPSMLNIRWDAAIGIQPDSYRVQYRLHTGHANDDWYETTTTDVFKTVSRLQGDTEYEIQIRAEQGSLFSAYSPVQIFKTSPAGSNNFVCKSDATPPSIPPGSPIQHINVNDVIHAGGYDVEVRNITASAGGSFTGEGAAVIPWFQGAKVHVTFKDINVNDQLWLTSGEIKTVWNAQSPFLQIVEKPVDKANAPTVGEIAVTIANAEELVQITGAVIVSVTHDAEGNAVVNTSDGQSKVLPQGKTYAVVDQAGNGYVVDKDGNVAKTTATEAQNAVDRGNRNYNLTVTFEKGTGKFGLDEKKYDQFAQFYQQTDSKYISWKAVTSSQPDEVDAVLHDASIDVSKLHFEVASQQLTVPAPVNNRYNLNVTGSAEGTVDELLAIYKPSDTDKDVVVGKLNLVSYDGIHRNLVVVPVNSETLPAGVTQTAIQTKLNAIYGQAVVDWNVTIAPKSLSITFDGDKFDDGNSGLLSNYTADMKKVIDAYGQLTDDTYYLFLINTPPASGNSALGYMPRSKQAGFIFVSNHGGIDITTTIAHEVGHGAFNLQHPFDEFTSLNTNGDNLMDYPAGSNLYKYQWDHIHNPQTVIGLFESDEQSEMTAKAFFWTPSGHVIYVESNSGGVTDLQGILDKKVPNGVLFGFTSNGIKYHADIHDGKFYGYRIVNGKDLFKDETVAKLKSLKDNKAQIVDVVSRIYVGNCTVVDYKNPIPIDQVSSLIDFSVGYPLAENDHYKEMTTKLTAVQIDKCSDYNYASLGEFGKSIFDLNKPRIPEQNWGLLFKIAALSDELGSDIFQDFVFKQKNDGNLFWSGENRSVPYSPEAFQTTYDNFNLFYNAVQKLKFYKYSTVDELINDVRAAFQVTKGSDNIFVFPSDMRYVQLLMGPFTSLTIERKKELLDVLQDADFDVTNNIGKNVDAGYVLNAIFLTTNTASIADKKNLIDYLDSKRYLQHFVEGLYQFQYETFINALFAMVLQVYPVPELQLNVNEGKYNYLTFNPALLQRNSESFANGQIDLQVKRWFDDDLYQVIAGPYDYVTVEFVANTDFGENLRFQKGQKVKMPAIWAYQLFWKDTKSGRWTTAKIVVDVALMACGAGEVAVALRTLRAGRTALAAYMAFKAAGDLGFGLLDLYINNAPDFLTDSQLKKWNTFFALWSVGSLSADAVTSFKTLLGKNSIDNLDDWKKFDNAFPDEELNQLRTESGLADDIEELPMPGNAALSNLGENIVDFNAVENLSGRIPSGSKLTNLNKTEFLQYGYKIKPEQGVLKSKVDEIIANGDDLGEQTEGIVDVVMSENSFTKLDGKYGTNNGYDGIYIKGSEDNPSEIVIVESKQFKYNNNAAGDVTEFNGAKLNPPSATTPLPAQMSDAWVLYVADKLDGEGKTAVSNMIKDNPALIKKYLCAVDKVNGEINFLRLANY